MYKINEPGMRMMMRMTKNTNDDDKWMSIKESRPHEMIREMSPTDVTARNIFKIQN